MRFHSPLIALAFVTVAACSDDDTTTAPPINRSFDQIERLGNPLTSEVFLAKRNHGFHNSGSPNTDAANHGIELRAFVRNVGGRSETVANTIATVLLPDMLIVQTDKPGSGAGWLTWALSNAYGGRKLTDDVVDAGLAAIFGPLLSSQNVTPQLVTDNVSANDKPFSTTFPYLTTPH